MTASPGSETRQPLKRDTSTPIYYGPCATDDCGRWTRKVDRAQAGICVHCLDRLKAKLEGRDERLRL